MDKATHIPTAHENTLADFNVGDVVLHVFHGRYATITKKGRKYLHVTINLSGQAVKWLPSSVVNASRF